jgi:hypothetical protein
MDQECTELARADLAEQVSCRSPCKYSLLSECVLGPTSWNKYPEYLLMLSLGLRPPLWSSGQEFLVTQRRCIVLPVSYELNLYT